ncbi:hypothetical protein DOTSEDRAFT_168591 [Lecanosticta acicola]|uniref:Fe2OG dioxygenase domain-containing protein n=1 Tax=Lecanosticta acicola TaxID=111012 RepID=A0AAI8W0E7_9PEZI|nr:hypothetical protein DOTSEDRAFT_168591 [Lecanosticta acicola]
MAPKAKSARTKSHTTPTEATATIQERDVPKWPSLQPLVPSSDLSIQCLLKDQILKIPRLWTASLCKNYVNFLSSLPLVTTPGKPKKGEAVRVNDRYQIDDPNFAEQLWSATALQALVTNPVIDGTTLTDAEKRELWGGEVLGLNSNIRIYRYGKGQFFDQHFDDSNNITFPSARATCSSPVPVPVPVPAKTTWTLLLYLTSPATGCEGGETVFYPEAPRKREAAPPPVIAELDVGMALLHRHGRECLLHEGREVTAGEKWVIRSDLCVKR